MKHFNHSYGSYGMIVSRDGSCTFLRNLIGSNFNIINYDLRIKYISFFFFYKHDEDLKEEELINYLSSFDLYMENQLSMWQLYNASELDEIIQFKLSVFKDDEFVLE